MTERDRVYVGTSGWVYPTWRAHLYQGIPARRWLDVASRRFGTLEVNGSFYGQIRKETYERWREQVPVGFPLCVKGHRFLTHYKRLRDPAPSIDILRDQARGLGSSLRCVIWQLPANFHADIPRLRGFLEALIERWADVRHSFELRHTSWFTAEVADLLASAGMANCMGDAPDFPMWNAVTTDFVYVRLHGHTRKYASSYADASLLSWARKAEQWAKEGRRVYLFLDNDAEGAAVRNALKLQSILTAAAA